MSEDRLAPTLKVIAPIAMARNRPLWIMVSLHNPFEETMLVNGRMLVGKVDTAPECHEIELTLTGPKSEAIDFAANISPPPPTENDFVEIPAGGELTREIRLDVCFNMTTPGKYNLKVNYSNTVEMARAGAEAFIGKVEALPVRLVVGV